MKGRMRYAIMLSVAMLTAACQPPPAPPAAQSEQTAPEAKTPLIEVKNQRVKLPQAQICDSKSCTQFDVQTVDTNLDWINAYFQERLKEIEPEAFVDYQAPSLEGVDPAELALRQVAMNVRYIGQHAHKATFVIHSYEYQAGAAHGLYHHEYVNLDLLERKRIALKDLIQKGKEKQLLELLYQANQTWLMERNIAIDALKLSDNFYYGAQGLILVYPLYEMASYAEGMTELILPYSVAAQVIEPNYLPVLPEVIVP